LRGSKSEKIREEHKQLKTYGVGADISKPDWQRYLRELSAMGYLQVDGSEYPVLKLTHQSEAVLKGLQKVEFIATETVEEKHTAVEALPFEANLLNELKNVRRDIATHENVPAYVILSDATLVEIATYLPQSLDELRMISGFGDIKLARYGREMLAPVKSYCSIRGLSSKIKQKVQKRERKPRPERSSDTRRASLTLFKGGSSIAEIAHERKLSPMTVESHLTYYVQTGDIDVSEFVTREKLKVIQDTVESYGDEKLSPLKEILGEDYSYTEIKAVIAWMKGQISN